MKRIFIRHSIHSGGAGDLGDEIANVVAEIGTSVNAEPRGPGASFGFQRCLLCEDVGFLVDGIYVGDICSEIENEDAPQTGPEDGFV
jgi:hypothetical protein